MPPVPMTVNRKVRCMKTGKWYVSVQHRSHARYRSWRLHNSEYQIEVMAIARSVSNTPAIRKRKSELLKERYRKDPSLRKKLSKAMIAKWWEKDFSEGMADMIGKRFNPTLKDGKPVIRFVRSEREKSTGVIVR